MRRVLSCTTLWVVMRTNVQIMHTVVRMVNSHVSSACPVSVRLHVSKYQLDICKINPKVTIQCIGDFHQIHW